jgi:hypothetical protein
MALEDATAAVEKVEAGKYVAIGSIAVVLVSPVCIRRCRYGRFYLESRVD